MAAHGYFSKGCALLYTVFVCVYPRVYLAPIDWSWMGWRRMAQRSKAHSRASTAGCAWKLHFEQQFVVQNSLIDVQNNARHDERRNYQLSRSRLCILMLLILLWLSCMLRYGSSSSSSTLSIWADVNNMKDILRFFSFFVFIAFCFCRRLLIVSNKSSLVDFTYLIFSWHFNNKSNAGRTN